MSAWFQFNVHDWALSFLSILFEGVPFLLLGALLSGCVDEWMPAALVARLTGQVTWRALLLSGLAGSLIPVCECGSVVVIRRLLRKGLPLPLGVTYMLAAPIVSPIVALSTLAAFRGDRPMFVTACRLGVGFLLAVSAGWITSRFSSSSLLNAEVLARAPARRPGFHIAPAPVDGVERVSFLRRLRRAVYSASEDFLGVAGFLVIGAGLSALFNTAVNQQKIAPLAGSPVWSTIAMMLLAVGLSVCSTSDSFIAASFVKFPLGAKLAFLIFGPLFDVKLAFLYRSLFRARFVVLLAVALFLAIALFGILVNVSS